MTVRKLQSYNGLFLCMIKSSKQLLDALYVTEFSKRFFLAASYVKILLMLRDASKE